MDIRNKIMFRMLLGFTLGLLVGIIMFVCYFPDGAPFERTFFICHLIGSSVIGVVGYGGAIVYDIESWSLGRATLTHFIVSFITLFALSEWLGWFSHDILPYVFIAFVLAYVIIWLLEYYIWRKQIKQMNENLKAMHKDDNQ